ncbi:MAG: PBECR4 domain-containing protein [Bacteroidota bacterium]|nr:PBECR4 domain-containing protein [Bacteroidota bacterium]
MDKQDALKIIFDCAKLYKDNLEGKNLIFLSVLNKTKFNYIETKFLKSNYQHLTGVVVDENKISPNNFYRKCINQRLSINDFDFKSDGTTLLKLSVLPQLMNISKNCNMIGNFNGSKPKLYANKLAGNVRACLGLSKSGSYYVPVTALKEDVRDLIIEQERIVAILSKSISTKLYTHFLYSAKDVRIESDIPDEILQKIDLENLTYNFNEKLIISNSITQKIVEAGLLKVDDIVG